jgi:hypothetical protein
LALFSSGCCSDVNCEHILIIQAIFRPVISWYATAMMANTIST